MATHGLPAWPWAETHADDLPVAEHLLLEGLRRWAAAASQGRSPAIELRPPFIA